MGIKKFSEIFAHKRIVKIKDFAKKTIAIDTMTELYRAALGGKSVNMLTDESGHATMHITVLLSVIVEMQKHKVDQIWVFDHQDNSTAEFHNPAKIQELLIRKRRKDIAQAKLDTLNQIVINALPVMHTSVELKEEFLGDLTDDEIKVASTQETKDKLEKQIFRPPQYMIDDIKLILNCLNIKYTVAPATFEGEQIASYLSATGQCDGVYSSDTDPIAFGAKVLYRKNTRDKKIYEYVQSDIIKQLRKYQPVATLADIRKVAVIAGTDFVPKTPGVGPKTILAKYKNIVLTDEQIAAIKTFEKEPDEDISTYNLDKTPFVDTNYKLLIEWLVSERSFSKERVIKTLGKVIDMDKTILDSIV
jgi:5'-3' exonuclease